MIQSFAAPLIGRLNSRQLLEQLYQERTLQPFSSGQIIPMHPGELWVVCRGVAVLNTLHPTGDEALLGIAVPSMPFGLPLTWVSPYQAIALTNVDLLPLTIAEVEGSPALCHELFHYLSHRLQQAEAFLALSSCRRVEDRLKQLLILLQREVGQPTQRGTRINVRLTHQQLADAISTTRVTVTRLIGQLKKEKWLAIDAKRHIILL